MDDIIAEIDNRNQDGLGRMRRRTLSRRREEKGDETQVPEMKPPNPVKNDDRRILDL